MKCGIESHAAFYCGHLIDDRSLTPLAVAWRRLSLSGFSSTWLAASARWRSRRRPRPQRNGPTSPSDP